VRERKHIQINNRGRNVQAARSSLVPQSLQRDAAYVQRVCLEPSGRKEQSVPAESGRQVKGEATL
jgi:hypothetical protein